MGYHKIKIEKGILSEYSKIKEEFKKLTDMPCKHMMNKIKEAFKDGSRS